MMKKVLIPVLILACAVIFCGAWVYVKKTNENEQLVLSEVRAHLNHNNDSQLKLVKPKLFSAYDEWYVEVKGSALKYQYINGEVTFVEVNLR